MLQKPLLIGKGVLIVMVFSSIDKVYYERELWFFKVKKFFLGSDSKTLLIKCNSIKCVMLLMVCVNQSVAQIGQLKEFFKSFLLYTPSTLLEAAMCKKTPCHMEKTV